MLFIIHLLSSCSDLSACRLVDHYCLLSSNSRHLGIIQIRSLVWVIQVWSLI